jgi:PBP1b-binding outer membrane lipoprotein LpoB
MKIIITVITIFLLLNGCSKVRESAGVTRKNIDEYKVVENPPLIIPPDFNLISPNKLEGKNIDEADRQLAKEILFGLDENRDVSIKKNSVINEILLESGALEAKDSIREEVDQGIAREIDTKDLSLDNWENEIEILDALKESECIRNKNFLKEKPPECINPIKIEKIKKKKKKRFIIF